MKYYSFVLGSLLFAFGSIFSTYGQEENSIPDDLLSEADFGGFGELHYQYDFSQNMAAASTVIALFEMDYHFTEQIKLHTETSFEGDPFGNFEEFEAQQLGLTERNEDFEVDLEELYLQFRINSLTKLKAGLFIMRSGLVAERHDPTTYRSVQMPEAEKQIIPGHWKEIGVELHGKFKQNENIHYSLGLVTGLNAAKFTNGTGIRKGRYGGINAGASNIALTSSLHFYSGYSRFQTSIYYGGAIGLSKERAKELELQNGPFGTPVFLPEINYKFANDRWDIRVVGALLSIPKAQKINRAFDQNVAKLSLGGYLEVAYDLLTNPHRTLYLFGRTEYLDMNYKRPVNVERNERLIKRYLVAGVNYLPIKKVAFKAEFSFRKTGNENPFLSRTDHHQPINKFMNMGIAYSF